MTKRNFEVQVIDIISVIKLIGGLLLLAAGGDGLIRGAAGVARRLGLSPLFIGLVLVGFGTSTPELATSLSAALKGSPGIAIGNVVGSNIANILLILGITAALSPVACDPRAFKRDGPMLAVATIACVVFALNGSFERLTGILFVVSIAAYVIYTYKAEKSVADASAQLHEDEAVLAQPVVPGLGLSLLVTIGGMIAIVLGANFMVSGAVTIAKALGIKEAIIGLTIISIGTSLPELATSIVAAMRRQTEMAFGNILGSNLFNILATLGVTAAVQPLVIPANIITYDLWVMVAATALLLIFVLTGSRISRIEGSILFSLYVSYLGFLTVRALGFFSS